MKEYSFHTGEITKFSIVDYVIFSAVLLFSAGIGLFYAVKDRKKSTTKVFLLAGGDMHVIPVALSLLASFMSAITLLGTPAEMYNFTTVYWWIGIGYVFVIACSAHLFVPIFYNLNVTSCFQYLELRFSKGVRCLGCLTFTTQMVLYMAIVLYAPSLALNAVTGFSLWGSVISVGLVCTFYTALGGMKAVLWTDTFQIGMMFAGLLAVLIRGSMEVGGFGKAWEIASQSQRVEFSDFSVDPTVRHSVWSLVIGATFTWTAIYGANQAQVQRTLTCPTLKKAQLALWINAPGLCLILLLGSMIGIVVFAFYSQCDPLQFKLIGASDQLLPLFVMDVLGDMTGFPGLFVACIFSGALSTISSGINSISAVILEDIIRAYFFKGMSDYEATRVSKLLAFIFGIICLGLTYVASLLGSVLQAALSLFGMIGGPLLGVFTLGMFFPWANTYGAYSGLISSLVFMFWIGVGAQVHKPKLPRPPVFIHGCNWNLTTTTDVTNASPLLTDLTTTSLPDILTNTTTLSPDSEEDIFQRLYSLSYLWYSATAVLTCVGVGLIVSFITGHTKPKDVDSKLICPFFDIAFPYLPEKILKPLRFGVQHKCEKVKLEKYEKDEESQVKFNLDN